MKDYEKIINLPHHVSQKHPQMPVADRAAQFASFAALKGYEAAVEEVARITDGRVDLDEDKRAELDVKLGILRGILQDGPQITVVFFIPDENKSGGRYARFTGNLSKINSYSRELVFSDGKIISADAVCELGGDAIDKLYHGV
ncbi:MAG: hypothetical protein LUF82_00600 [Clostridia bacterium]|nr:hypothetical protein [Clostridia bacterium]